MKFASRQSVLIAAVATVCTASFAQAQVAVWEGPGDPATFAGGSWNDPLNWDIGAVPNAIDASATFNSNQPAARVVNLDTAVTVGSITVNNSTGFMHSIANGGGGPLTFDVSTGNATFTVTGTSTTQTRLNTTMVFNDTLVANISSPDNVGTAGSFLLGGAVTGSGGFTKTGSGRMTLANTPGQTGLFKNYTGPTIINDGRVRVSLDGVPRSTSMFTIENKGQLTPIGSGNYSPGGVNAATTVLSISGSGPTEGPNRDHKGAILPDANFDVTFNNPVLLPGGEALVHSRKAIASVAGSITFTNKISGAGTLVLTAPAGDEQLGRYVLQSAESDYTGGTIIWGGTVDATAGRLGAPTAPLTVNIIADDDAPSTSDGVSPQTTVLLNTSAPTTVGALSGFGNGNSSTINNGGQLFTVNQGAAGTYDGVITGAGGLTLGSLSTNTLTLTGANTYGGDTTLAGGTLAIASEANIGTSTNAIQFNGGNLQTNAAVAFTRNAAVNSGTGGIDTNGFDSTINTVTGAGGFTKSGVGKLTATQVKVGGALAVSGGALEVSPEGGAAGTVETSSLTVAPGARLNLNDNDVIVNYSGASPEAAIRQLVRDGRASGSTSGIFSTPGPTSDDRLLAVVDNAEWGKTAYGSFNIDTDTVVGKYTFLGDSNLDGAVTGDDYLAVDSNLGTGTSWIDGDFNLDNAVTGDDYLAIDTNLGKGTPTPLAFAELKAEMIAKHVAMFGEEYLVKLAEVEANGFTIVPEPAALSLIGFGAIGLLGRRRARERSN